MPWTMNSMNGESNAINATQNNTAVTWPKEESTNNISNNDLTRDEAKFRSSLCLEDVLQYSEYKLSDAAKHLNVSRSTLKRVCRDLGIGRWPPRKKQKSNNSVPRESTWIDVSEEIHQSNLSEPLWINYMEAPQTTSDLPSKPAANDANNVVIKAKYGKDIIIKFQLPLSAGLADFQQEVAKRLKMDGDAYDVKYEDEDADLILIACDEDLQDYMLTCQSQGRSSATVFLEPRMEVT